LIHDNMLGRSVRRLSFTFELGDHLVGEMRF